MENTVTEQEANAFDPTLGQCCDPAHFRVHLEGTTCNTWNKSATSVFAGRFLTAHPEYPSHEQSVRDMVQMKSRAALDSMIREYRKSNTPRTEPELREEQKRKNRQERKRKVGTIISISSSPPIVTGHVSSIIAAATLRSCTRLSYLNALFWNNLDLLGCPATRSGLWGTFNSMMLSSLHGGLTSSPHGFESSTPSTRMRKKLGCMATSVALPLVCE